ncbi:MAG: hypothetical protein P8O76_03605 [Methylophilaceae bacterium]|nr:hypothetical protein [Methylophilaceae bacterium]
MTESLLIQKKWIKLEGLSNLPQDLLEKIVSVCSGALSLRVTQSTNETFFLEILSENVLEFHEGEALIHQAIADEKLRQRIKIESNKEITFLIDGILTKVASK